MRYWISGKNSSNKEIIKRDVVIEALISEGYSPDVAENRVLQLEKDREPIDVGGHTYSVSD